MFEKERIQPFINKLEELWTQYPDLRFGQVVNMLQKHIRRDLYNTTDAEWLNEIENELIRVEARKIYKF
jgi:hypothetical protein